MNAYTRLEQKFARIATLNEAASVLGWDAAAMMPSGGAAARGDQLAVLAGISHEMLTAPAIADDLAAAGHPNDEWRAKNLELMRDAHLRATALPQDLVEASSIARSKCETIWRSARPASNFAEVRPALEDVFRLTREAAAVLGETLNLSPYDALMTQYQRGITAADVTPIFARYETFLQTALPKAEELQARHPDPELPPGPYPADIQERLCRQLSEAAGLKYSNARLDRSAHPFCGGTQSDIRITTRYDEMDPLSAITGVLHETGHAMYEQNLPQNFLRQPVGEAAGMATHESQSLIIEMQAVRSDGYLRHLAPILTAAFNKPVTFANLKHRLRRVERSLIRVEADEMTYPAHVILRFRLEQALISGDLAIADLPGAWNDGIKSLLGITPPDDRQGCLQDIHWYDGLVGYFPAYSLGAMAAAQLIGAARNNVPGLDDSIARGDLSLLVNWLSTNIHGAGARLGFNELLLEATGSKLNPQAFEDHLSARYL